MKPWVYMLALLTAAAVVAYAVVRQMRFALPAPLNAVHAGLEADCFACHTRDHRVDPRLCATCHKDPATGKSPDLKGFARHHLYQDLDCLDCHTEHRGRAGDLTRPGRILEDSDCATCHARDVGKGYVYMLHGPVHPSQTLHQDHVPWQDDCTVCHVRGGGLDARLCTECHDPKTGAEVKFTGFATHHTYSDLDCLDCHTEHAGRRATLLKPGKSIQTAGCRTCHERDVGPGHLYQLASDKHPQDQLSPAHAPWAGDCAACHKPGTDRYECVVCHDPKTGRQLELKDFASHHFRADLKCLDCHTDHRGAARGATTKPSVHFADIDCNVCHAEELKKPTPLDKVPPAVRGVETTFLHSDHPQEKVACTECHAMKPGESHVSAGPYSLGCSDCHHKPQQRAECADCHRQTADYFAGRLDGKLLPLGTHARSGSVTCADCHPYDLKAHRFDPTESTCGNCHPQDYARLFVEEREGWQKWLAGADTDRLRFIGRNWYHNDVHASSVREANPKP